MGVSTLENLGGPALSSISFPSALLSLSNFSWGFPFSATESDLQDLLARLRIAEHHTGTKT